MKEYRGTMFRYSIFSLVAISALVCQSWACSPRCVSKKDLKAASRKGKQHIVYAFEMLDAFCRYDNRTDLCDHTVIVPGGILEEGETEIRVKYSGVVLNETDSDLQEERNGNITFSLSFSISNLTVFVNQDKHRPALDVSENQFKIILHLKLQKPFYEVEEGCYFEWGRVQVNKFEFSVRPDGATASSLNIVDKFRVDSLRDIVNDEPFQHYLNREASFCNDESSRPHLFSGFLLENVIDGLTVSINRLLYGLCD